ncbi:MAG: MBL fold metallo-hydrolase [Chloroflexota bacterium]
MIIATSDDMQIEKLILGAFGTNAYIIKCRKTGESVLVDAPAEAGKILERLNGTSPRYILLTHSHMDHTGALAGLLPKLKIPLAAHAAEAGNLPSPPEIILNDGDTIACGNIRLAVLHTPGHTPDSLCFKAEKYLLAGDTIFPGGPGHTGSPAAFQQIVKSIRDKIMTLEDDTEIHPGHGVFTVLKKEKGEFAAFSSRQHDPRLCGDVLWLSA